MEKNQKIVKKISFKDPEFTTIIFYELESVNMFKNSLKHIHINKRYQKRFYNRYNVQL